MVVQVRFCYFFESWSHFVLTAVLGDRFNYVTSAALDGGTTIALLVIFLTVQIHQSQGLQWWGNLINSKSEHLD
jgi:hypothetical protein